MKTKAYRLDAQHYIIYISSQKMILLSSIILTESKSFCIIFAIRIL